MSLNISSTRANLDEIAQILQANESNTQPEIVRSLAKNLFVEVSELRKILKDTQSKLTVAEDQVAWFKRQIFGRKTEKRIVWSESHGKQMCFGEMFDDKAESISIAPSTEVQSYQRGKAKKKELLDDAGESGLRFSDNVPIREIEVPNPEVAGLSSEQYEVVSTRICDRLAKQEADYVVLRYKMKTVKLKESGNLSTPPAPPAVIERSFADVSFLGGLLVDKFLYHMPLYRQHQRLKQAGIQISRSSLTNLCHRAI